MSAQDIAWKKQGRQQLLGISGTAWQRTAERDNPEKRGQDAPLETSASSRASEALLASGPAASGTPVEGGRSRVPTPRPCPPHDSCDRHTLPEGLSRLGTSPP